MFPFVRHALLFFVAFCVVHMFFSIQSKLQHVNWEKISNFSIYAKICTMHARTHGTNWFSLSSNAAWYCTFQYNRRTTHFLLLSVVRYQKFTINKIASIPFEHSNIVCIIIFFKYFHSLSGDSIYYVVFVLYFFLNSFFVISFFFYKKSIVNVSLKREQSS